MRLDNPEDLVGETIGNFEILELIGKGGSGFVFRAKQIGIEREVAVKVRGSESLDAALLRAQERFRQEISAMSDSESSHILPIHAASTPKEELQYLAMKYCPTDLGDTMREKGVPRGNIEIAAWINRFAQLLEGIEVVHNKGYLHRDIKPSNVYVDAESGKKKVMIGDFSVVSRIGAAREKDDSLTLEDQIIGTPAYMAPEQTVPGQPLDKRTDLWAIGVLMYEVFTGKKPFERRKDKDGNYSENNWEFFNRIQNEDPPKPSKSNEAIPPDLEQVILKLLEKRPENRYQNAAEVINVLEGFALSLQGSESKAYEGFSRRTGLIGAAGVAALALAARYLPPFFRGGEEPLTLQERVRQAQFQLQEIAVNDPRFIPVLRNLYEGLDELKIYPLVLQSATPSGSVQYDDLGRVVLKDTEDVFPIDVTSTEDGLNWRLFAGNTLESVYTVRYLLNRHERRGNRSSGDETLYLARELARKIAARDGTRNLYFSRYTPLVELSEQDPEFSQHLDTATSALLERFMSDLGIFRMLTDEHKRARNEPLHIIVSSNAILAGAIPLLARDSAQHRNIVNLVQSYMEHSITDSGAAGRFDYNLSTEEFIFQGEDDDYFLLNHTNMMEGLYVAADYFLTRFRDSGNPQDLQLAHGTIGNLERTCGYFIDNFSISEEDSSSHQDYRSVLRGAYAISGLARLQAEMASLLEQSTGAVLELASDYTVIKARQTEEEVKRLLKILSGPSILNVRQESPIVFRNSRGSDSSLFESIQYAYRTIFNLS